VCQSSLGPQTSCRTSAAVVRAAQKPGELGLAGGRSAPVVGEDQGAKAGELEKLVRYHRQLVGVHREVCERGEREHLCTHRERMSVKRGSEAKRPEHQARRKGAGHFEEYEINSSPRSRESWTPATGCIAGFKADCITVRRSRRGSRRVVLQRGGSPRAAFEGAGLLLCMPNVVDVLARLGARNDRHFLWWV